MSVFTVKSVAPEPREWTSQHGGTFLSYKVDLEEEDGRIAKGVEWNRKPESQPPNPGERVAGHLESGRYSEKFKLDFETTKELGSGGAPPPRSTGTPAASKGTGKPWTPEGERDPERAARILRQHSQEMALRFCVLTGQRVDLTQVFSYADQFDQDVLQAGKAAVQGAGAASPSQTSEGQQSASHASHAPTTPAPEQRPTDDSHQYFCKLLEDAAMDPVGASAIAGFIVEKFSPEQKQKVDLGLKVLETQPETIKKLRTSYEQTENRLVPVPSGEEDIPF